METKEEKIVKIPESITINGVTYAVKDTPELQSFIQEVAKVEKSKLYTQFEALKAQIKALSDVQVVSDPNIEAMLAKMKETFITKDDLKQSLAETVKEAVKPLIETDAQNKKNTLDAYRESLIKMNEGTCIPELVKGETKEEIDASLAESIRIRAKYPSPVAPHQPQGKVTDPLLQQQFQAQEQIPTPPAQPAFQAPSSQPMPQVPNRPSPEAGEDSGRIRRMSQTEFANNREQLLQQLQETYGG